MFKKTFFYFTLISSCLFVLWKTFVYSDNLKTFSVLNLQHWKLENVSSERRSEKLFVYLVQTESCLPSYLANKTNLGEESSCRCDVIVISYTKKCTRNNFTHVQYIDSKCTWTSGRNKLLFAALGKNVFYQYFIFADDDIRLTHFMFSPEVDRNLSPFRAYENWLFRFQPAVGVVDYSGNFISSYAHVLNVRKQRCNQTDQPLEVTTAVFDPLFNGFHHEVVTELLPYIEYYDFVSWWHSHWFVDLGAEVKFRGQTVMYAALKVANPKNRPYPRSWQYLNNAFSLFVNTLHKSVPETHQNDSLFYELKKNPEQHLVRTSSTYCMKARANVSKIPYAHFVKKQNRYKSQSLKDMQTVVKGR